jgi:hypothetical protein
VLGAACVSVSLQVAGLLRYCYCCFSSDFAPEAEKCKERESEI